MVRDRDGGGGRRVVFVFGYILDPTWSHVIRVSMELLKIVHDNIHNYR